MPTAAKPPTTRRKPTFITTSYDKVAGWLLALVIFVGVVLFCVFVIWLTNQAFSSTPVRPFYPPESGGGDPDGTDDRGLDLDMPLADQIAQETDLDEELEQSFDMVIDVLGTRVAEFQDPFDSDVTSGGQSGGSTGTGDDQAKGEGGGPGSGVAREDRWIILYDQTSLNTYAKQLDQFGIELGAIGRGQIVYVKNLAAGSPTVRKETGNVKENRLRFSWTSGTLQQYDRSLLQKAGVDPTGLIIVHFYTPEMENELADLEYKFNNVEGKDIRRTRFGVRGDGKGGYEHYVIDQELL